MAVIATVCLALASASAMWSALSGSTSNQSNVLSAGTVSLSDNDQGGVMFSVAGMRPDDSVTRCVQVTYTGSLAGLGSSHATGLVDPKPAWVTGEKHTYQVQVTLADDYSAKEKTAATTINWEARNT